jgi:hypothetical protein
MQAYDVIFPYTLHTSDYKKALSSVQFLTPSSVMHRVAATQGLHSQPDSPPVDTEEPSAVTGDSHSSPHSPSDSGISVDIIIVSTPPHDGSTLNASANITSKGSLPNQRSTDIPPDHTMPPKG